mgnify:FL=1
MCFDCGLSFDCQPSEFLTVLCSVLHLFCVFFRHLGENQAWKTGMLNPMAFFYARQIEAVNLTTLANLLCVVSGLGNSLHCFLVWMSLALPFYYSNWEEYHLGSTKITPLVGTTDQWVLTALLCIGLPAFKSSLDIQVLVNLMVCYSVLSASLR